MQTFHTKVQGATRIAARLVLAYDQREKCRLRARLDDGEEIALFTVRGTVLRGGDLLTGDDGRVIQVVAADEPTYLVQCPSVLVLARCAFHLGNRHTQAQVGESHLRIRQDAVLRDMLVGLGAVVTEELAPFEPESGAYGGGHHHHDLLAPVPLRQKIHRPGEVAA